MRTFLVLALSLLLAVSAAPALAEDGRSGGHDGGLARQGGRSGENHTSGEHGATSIGAFAQAGHDVSGQFVSFSYGPSGAQGFTVDGAHVFDVAIAPAGGASTQFQVDASGAQIRIRSSAYTLQVHDNPEAVTQIDVQAGTITLTLAPGATAQASGEETAAVSIGNLTGKARPAASNHAGGTITTNARS